MYNKIVTLTGPSASGKTTLLKELLKRYPFEEIISTTTRKPREGEMNGISYYFVSDEEFDKIPMMESVVFTDKKYGASVKEFEDKIYSGNIPIVIVEPNGAEQIIENAPKYDLKPLTVFIDCDDEELLFRRFLTRFGGHYKSSWPEDEEEIVESYSKRLKNMLTVERDWAKMLSWNLYFSRYTEDVQENVIEEIWRNVKES